MKNLFFLFCSVSAIFLHWNESPPAEGVIRYEVRHGYGDGAAEGMVPVVPQPAELGWKPSAALPDDVNRTGLWASVTAVNAVGAGVPQALSLPPEEPINAGPDPVHPIPSPPPTQLYLQIVSSEDLEHWTTEHLLKIPPGAPKRFYQLRVIQFTPPAP